MEPLITDWIQAFGVLLGVPITAWGIIKLFRKNTEFERKIELLDSIVQNQEILNNSFKEQVTELKIQTDTLSARNELASESNKNQRELIEIQNKVLLNDKKYSEESAELFEKDRKTKIKPYFIVSLGNSDGKKRVVGLKNVGKKAIMRNPIEQNTEEVLVKFNFRENQVIEAGKTFTFEIEKRKKEININSYELDIIVPFSNSEGDNYTQKVRILRSEVNILQPEEK